ncbi:MAG: aminotransferase class IV family protein [Chloroflexi bacterium]|nr:aminotransferase class IV family protein [Chloroflexota bacterium]
MRARDGRVFAFERHLARLRRGAGVLALPLPPVGELERLVCGALADVQPDTWVTLRLSISRGFPRQRGLLPDPDAIPTVVLHRAPLVPYPADLYDRGVTAIVSAVRRNEHSPLATIKSLCYLENVLARQAAAARGAGEALLCNTAGELACASAMNLFAVFGAALVTPPLSSGALPGTVRALILEKLAPVAGLEPVERPLVPEDLARCDEAFLTNALAGVLPLVQVDGHPVGDGAPGRWSRRLYQILADVWKSE